MKTTLDIMHEAGRLSVSEAATLVGVQPPAIHKLIASGKLDSEKGGPRNVYVHVTSLLLLYSESETLVRRIKSYCNDHGVPYVA